MPDHSTTPSPIFTPGVLPPDTLDCDRVGKATPEILLTPITTEQQEEHRTIAAPVYPLSVKGPGALALW